MLPRRLRRWSCCPWNSGRERGVPKVKFEDKLWTECSELSRSVTPFLVAAILITLSFLAKGKTCNNTHNTRYPKSIKNSVLSIFRMRWVETKGISRQSEHITTFPKAYLDSVAHLLVLVCTDGAIRVTRGHTGTKRPIRTKLESRSVMIIILARSCHLR